MDRSSDDRICKVVRFALIGLVEDGEVDLIDDDNGLTDALGGLDGEEVVESWVEFNAEDLCGAEEVAYDSTIFLKLLNCCSCTG